MRRAAFEQTRLMKESVCFFDENAFGGTIYGVARSATRRRARFYVFDSMDDVRAILIAVMLPRAR